ncbi:cytochrome P450 [Novosphingobium sp. ERW19]|uniref:cytochrome P450 n=1 Tax=Novosphingobium sp. ERW19 TaxID=2726186 RepID=UPI0014564DB1|nr:cytochrome P450 [Novosphingobium sp. ERW19]NLR39889.1 cytochrome P450 [Novosphingobium sp. ERW19]
MTLLFQPSPPDHVPTARMVDFDMFHIPEGVSDPAEIWHDLVRRGVPDIFYTPHNGGHWVFLRYEDIVEAYRDHSIFSTYQTPVPPIEPFPVVQPQGVDPPAHNVFRRLLAPMFTPTAVRGMIDELERRAAVLIDGFAERGACDFISDFAERYPTGTFLYLFGLPEERLDEFLALANTFFRSTDPAARALNIGEIYAVLDQLFREKERNPGNDIATQIVMARDENGAQHSWEDILNCGFLLFVAGLDTVTNTMAYIWRYLATTPAAQKHFRDRLDDPDGFLRGIEELMRINAVSNLFRRVTHDCEYRGLQFRRNDRVVLPNTVANRDPRVFKAPQVIDLDREVNVHLTFGVGPHRCIGSVLAKREVMVSLQQWLRRIPEFSLANEQPAGSVFGGSVMGFTALRLQWEVAAEPAAA